MVRLPRLAPSRLGALLLAGALAVTAFLWWRSRPAEPFRVVLSALSGPSDGLDLSQRRALRDWVQWQLEAGGCTVLLPGTILPKDLPSRTRMLELRPRRVGDQLALGWRQAKAGDLADQGEEAWAEQMSPAREPALAMRALFSSLPLPAGSQLPERLLTRRADTFWHLIDAVGANRDTTRLSSGYDLALSATRDEPDCAMAWMVLGDLQYRRMLVAPESDPTGQATAERHFRRALELAPATPQAIFLLAQLKVDSGDHAAALQELSAGLRNRPRALSLRSALVYAARTAGLMGLAREALARMDDLVPEGLQASTAENAWLYLGNRPRFEASLQTSPDEPRSIVASFYRGYLALADGNTGAAAAWFHRSGGMSSYSQFTDLAEVFELIATSQPDAARARLRRLADNRAGLRVPDGEFTFKLAEAHALLGEATAAQDAAEKAFAQGFGCTTWYEQSPFLGAIRGTPRWRALISHLLDRQRLLERNFPPSAFA
ncbi:MAG TPA: tetratricopeptide repeat protein [Holophagaceae bacterium]|jgi:tetratricopeptide (TPR) repeat protein|nr:tetratricopeptide repeat protein [Holophagaceae bacterium]